MEKYTHKNYYNTGNIEVIDFIEDQEFNFNLGNVVKYISRAGKKPGARKAEDIGKALWYLRKELDKLDKLNNKE